MEPQDLLTDSIWGRWEGKGGGGRGEVGIAVEILGQHLAECNISYSLNWEGWAGMSLGQEQCGTFT